jgi:ethanolamine ammonia-lyase small subunit
MAMIPPAPPQTPRDLRQLTPARVGLGRAGASLPTQALLAFTLDHARARDAVHARFEVAAIVSGLEVLGLETQLVSSQASDRHDYLKRPDLGRRLDLASQRALAARATDDADCTIVIGDGLSPSAVNGHAVALVGTLLARLAADGVRVGPVVVACGARVALGDEIGTLIGTRMVVMLIGERPGLSAPGSLGAYLTFAPKPGLTDADRNCVSNIHSAGLTRDEAAFKIAWLIRESLARRVSGVALKDESAVLAPLRVTDGLGGA